MNISNKVAYLMGLAEGKGINDTTDEGKIMLAILDVLSDMADVVDSLDFEADIVSEKIDDLDEELGYLLDRELDSTSHRHGHHHSHGHCGCQDEEYDGDVYEVICPKCDEQIFLDEEMLDDGEIICPKCQNILELDFEDVFDGDEDFVDED